MIDYTFANTDDDLNAILNLQKANLKANISPIEAEEQGFVTCNHSFEVLKLMNHPYPHIIAKHSKHPKLPHHQKELAGYALVMLKSHADEVPEIISMFTQINQLNYQGKALKKSNYVVMGQICVAKKFRGKGVFTGLYETMFTALKPHYAYLITGISTSNKRSIKAHQKVGFQSIINFKDDLGEWVLVLKDLAN